MAEQIDTLFMREALVEAQKAYALGEVPVGAVIVHDGKIISRGYNRRETGKTSIGHAEMEAIGGACQALGTWRLSGCALYVTLEPCPMCAGAVINSRIGRLVFGARDPKAGACRSVVELFSLPFNHRPQISEGVLRDECSRILKDFFQSLRQK